MSQLSLFGPPVEARSAAEDPLKPKAQQEHKPPGVMPTCESPFDLPEPDRDDASPDVGDPPGPKEPKPRPQPQPEPKPSETGPIQAAEPVSQAYDVPCMRCGKKFLYRCRGSHGVLCGDCSGVGDAHDPLPNVKLEDRCILIGCACVTMGAEIQGHPVCNEHDTDKTREIMASGHWPAWYGYEGKMRVVATIRRMDELGHTWEGIGFNEKSCGTCGLRYAEWVQHRFKSVCVEYEKPRPQKGGLFRP